MKLILVAGVYRSCSTWLYNAARMYLQKVFGEKSVYGCYITDYNSLDSRYFHVVKTHEFSEELAEKAALVILSERNFSEMAASMSKFLGEAYTPAFMKKKCEYYQKYRDYHSKSVIFEYSEIVFSINGELAGKYFSLYQLMNAMNENNVFQDFKWTPMKTKDLTALLAEIEALATPDGTPDYADPVTLLHPNHISNI